MTEDELYEGLSTLFHPWIGMGDMDLDEFVVLYGVDPDGIDLNNEENLRDHARSVLMPILNEQPLLSRRSAEKAARFVQNQRDFDLKRFFEGRLITLKIPSDIPKFMGILIAECFK
jgi:hypothetical protein